MADILATIFRLRLFIFEYGPWFVAAWLGLGLATGLLARYERRLYQDNLGQPFSSSSKSKPLILLRTLLIVFLRSPNAAISNVSSLTGWRLFGLAATVPSLVVTPLIGMEVLWLRLALTVVFVASLSGILKFVVSGSLRRREEGLAEPAVLLRRGDGVPPSGLRQMGKVSWKTFTARVNAAVVPLLIGFALASALTVYVPAYLVRPWFGQNAWSGPYLAAIMATPLQLNVGAEVLLASALLTKGASLGSAMSTMLVAPVTAFSAIRCILRPVKAKTIALYLAAAWLAAGSLGLAVDGIQRLF